MSLLSALVLKILLSTSGTKHNAYFLPVRLDFSFKHKEKITLKLRMND